MTGEEQIICKYKFEDKEKFNGKPYCTCFNELCEDLSFACDNNCQIYEDFKQLARKTQECEELKKDLQRGFDNFLKQKEELFKEIKCYRKALEKIEFEVTEELKETEVDTDAYGCFLEILNTINKVKVEE